MSDGGSSDGADRAAAALDGLEILDAVVRPMTLALAHPMHTSRGVVDVRHLARLRLRCGSARGTAGDRSSWTGLGEIAPISWIDDTALDPGQAERTCRRLRGLDAGDARQIVLEQQAPVALRAALETALCDAAARRSQLPLALWLVALRSFATATATATATDGDLRVPVSAFLPTDTDAAVAAARAASGKGCVAAKLKVGVEATVDAEAARIARVAGALGSRVRLRLDANGAWSVEQAASVLAALAAAGVTPDFLEEPCAGVSPRGLADLQRRARMAGTTLAVDESVIDGAGLDAVVEAGSAGVVVLKLARVGGPLAALALAERAHAAGLRVVVTDGLDGEVGLAAMAHTAVAVAAITGRVEPVGSAASVLVRDNDRDGARFAPVASWTLSGAGSGMGVDDAEDVDEDTVETLR